MTRTLLLCSLAFLSTATQAQLIDHDRNWVSNGDFETVEGKKLKRTGGIEYATGWGSATKQKADLFSEDATNETGISVPKNFAGEQSALSGINYAGVRWWSYGNKEPRSYLQSKLAKPMKKDSLYCVSFYVNLGDLSKYATGELGAYFGKQRIEQEDAASLTYEVKVPQLRTKIYDDVFSWQGVCGAYKADGFEQFLTIGNFS
ncbi:MAG: hypothetical protein KBA60_01305, partial [Flavobacteriales bacterium]|nr:hypothetical protein [Flavobacteriales bacterium]